MNRESPEKARERYIILKSQLTKLHLELNELDLELELAYTNHTNTNMDTIYDRIGDCLLRRDELYKQQSTCFYPPWDCRIPWWD